MTELIELFLSFELLLIPFDCNFTLFTVVEFNVDTSGCFELEFCAAKFAFTWTLVVDGVMVTDCVLLGDLINDDGAFIAFAGTCFACLLANLAAVAASVLINLVVLSPIPLTEFFTPLDSPVPSLVLTFLVSVAFKFASSADAVVEFGLFNINESIVLFPV